MTMTAEQLAQLREIANNATPGGWCSDDYHGVIADAGLNGNYYIASCSGPEHRSNKRFIAAFNPAVVLALLDELERKDKRIAELEARTVALSKPQMVKHVSGEFIHCWPAYTVDSAIRAAGINLTVEG